nr:uncharacterized protein LOC117975691 [Pan paniscus]
MVLNQGDYDNSDDEDDVNTVEKVPIDDMVKITDTGKTENDPATTHKEAKNKRTPFLLDLKLEKEQLPLHFGFVKLLLQAASASESPQSPSRAGTRRGGDSGPSPSRAGERKAGATVSLEGSERRARATSAGGGRLGTRWRCRTESQSLGRWGDGKRRHRIPSFALVAGNVRCNQPLVPDIKTSGGFPREGGARTGTERRPTSPGAETRGGASGPWLLDSINLESNPKKNHQKKGICRTKTANIQNLDGVPSQMSTGTQPKTKVLSDKRPKERVGIVHESSVYYSLNISLFNHSAIQGFILAGEKSNKQAGQKI